jgi:integrase
MKYLELETDPLVKDFLRSRTLRKTTEKVYVRRIKKYSKFLGKTPTEFIDEAEEEQDKGIKRRKRQINSYIYDFVELLKSENHSAYSIKSNVETIVSFYKQFDVDTPSLRNLLKNQNKNVSFETLLNKDQIKQIVDQANVRDKAIILIHFSSGMGASEVRHLTFRDFLIAVGEYININELDKQDALKVAINLKNRDDLIGTWKIHRFKTGMPYVTFTSPEATKAIINYIIDRYRTNKPIKSLDDVLIVNQSNKKLSATGYTLIFARLNEKLELGRRSGKIRSFTSHILRKMFTTTLYQAGLDKLAIDWMLGHKIDPVTEAYFKTNIADLKRNYTKVLHHLTLEKVKIQRIESNEVKDIVRDLDKKDKEIKMLRKENAMTQKIVKDLIETMKMRE